MKVLLINKFLYPRGGDCIYTMSLGKLLRKAGHIVCFYAMDYSEHTQNKDSSFFAEEISFSATGFFKKIKAANRVLWGWGIKQGFGELLDDFQPDIVHLNNIHSYLSPIVAKLAYRRGIKVIWTLHDYKLICPSYSCLYKEKNCKACFTYKGNVLLRKCMKNSILASALALGEALYWNKNKLLKWTDTFICPSYFMAKMMQSGGYPTSKLRIINNFIGEEQVQYIKNFDNPVREQAYAYIGRLSKEKGIESCLKVASRLSYKLYIAGTGPLEADLKEKYEADNIIFLGYLTMKDTIKLLKKVSFTIIPSICYENNPLSVIESLCCGTPILGRNIGGIPELLELDSCNQLFTQDKELPDLIIKMFETVASTDRNKLSIASLQRFSVEHYYQKWLEVVGKE